MGPPRSLAIAIVIPLVIAGAVGVAGSATGAPGTPAQCSFPYTDTDATGTAVTVEREPQRIVTLGPSAAQTMWEIGGAGKVVGVTEHAAYLEGAETRENVSGAGQSFVDIERVVDLEPDLVLAPNIVSNGTVAKLREAGLTVYGFPFQTSLDDIRRKTLRTGRLTGECAGAGETAAWMDAELRTVRDAVEGADRPRVLYVFWEYTGGTGTFAHTVIEAAGGTNVAATANISGYQPINPEIVVAHDPEWIVVNDGATQIPETAAYNNTHAVRNDQIVVLREEYISQPAPRIVRSVTTLTRALHPAAYERAARGTGTSPAGTASPTLDRSPTPGGTPTSTGATAPGFGVGVAVIALLLVAHGWRVGS